MIKILDNTKTLSELEADTSGGIGSLDVFDATVTEELNGIYEAEFKILVSEKYYSDLAIDSIVKIPVNEAGEEQLFRVYYISPEIDGMALVKLQHITYDLSKVAVQPFSATGAVNAKNGMLSHMMGTYPFNMMTDITNTTSTFTLDIPRSFRECLGGYEGSLLDVFRGEYEWDNLTVRMLANRGADNGVRIAYGKNLTDLKQETNNENVYTAVLGYAVVDDTTYTGDIYHKIVATYPRVKIVDFSSDYDSDHLPTTAALTAKAQSYAENNSIEIPKVNITISFIPLYQTEEYKNIAPLERVSLGDTVHVFFDKMRIEASSRVVKTVWNINTGRYDSIELGNTKANLNTVIDDSVNSAVNNALINFDVDTGAIEEELENLSQLIVNGLGLHITKDSAGRIYLHNEENLSDSQYQYIITSQGFMLSKDGGQSWTSGWDISGNAVLNSLSTIILKALEIHGSVIVFGDEDDKYITAYPYVDSNENPLGVMFDGTGEIKMQPEGRFEIDNMYNNVVYNQMYFTRSADEGTGDQIYLSNKDINGNTANYIRLAANRNFNSSYGWANYFAQQNYDYDDPTKLSNFINFISTSADSDKSAIVSRNIMFVTNKKKDNTNANTITLSAYPNGDSLNIYNYNYNSSLAANEILMASTVDSNSVDYTSLNVNNKKPNSSTYANQLNMKGAVSEDYLYLTNIKYGGSSLIANRTGFVSNSTHNDAYFMNYKRDYNALANKLEMKSNGSTNSIELNNRKYDSASSDAYWANSIMMNAESSETYLEIKNANQSNTNLANDIKLLSSSTGYNSLTMSNYDSSGNLDNEIEMGRINSSGTYSATTTIWSSNDLRLRSGGAVRIDANMNRDGSSSYNGQDIHFTGTTMHFYFTNKFSFHIGSQRYNCDFSGMSVGTSYPLYVTRVS